MIQKLPPIQFNFFNFWKDDLANFSKDEKIESAFLELKKAYEDIALWVYEETIANGFHDKAKAELGLSLHTALVKYKDLHWLRENFEGCDLAPLALAISRTVYPGDNWEIFGEDEIAIVTNNSRTIVFDLKNFDNLGALASLAQVNDEKLQMNKDAAREIATFKDAQFQKELGVLSVMNELLNKFPENPQVLEFDKDKAT